MKAKNEKEIDDIVTSQAEDEDAWTESQLIKNRSNSISREKFLRILSKVPDVEPPEEDKLTSG
jgi:hypothetical protein